MHDVAAGFEFLSDGERAALDALGQLLLRRGRQVNLTAARTLDELWTRHFADALAALQILDDAFQEPSLPPPHLIDVGAGAGLPGLPLAILRPPWGITLLEATRKKSDFQRDAVAHLRLENVEVLNARAEDVARTPERWAIYDGALSRAVASLGVVIELVMPFLRIGGSAVLWKGPALEDELEEGRMACEATGAEIDRIVPYRLPGDAQAPEFRLVVLRKVAPTSLRYPRSAARLKRTPYRP